MRKFDDSPSIRHYHSEFLKTKVPLTSIAWLARPYDVVASVPAAAGAGQLMVAGARLLSQRVAAVEAKARKAVPLRH